MRPWQLTLLVMMLLAGSAASPTMVETVRHAPMTAAREQGEAVAKTTSGTMRWRNRWTMEQTSLDGQPVLYFTENGEGIRSP